MCVGRDAELATLTAALHAGPSGPRLIYLYGAGGVGKTTLLRQFVARCRGARARVTSADLRDLDPTPEALLGALGRSASLRRGRGPHAIVIDAYQPVDLLDRWLRETLLALLPATTLVVVATRDAPSPSWLAAPGWRRTLVPLPLRALDDVAARALLAALGAPPRAHDEALALTRGHPLALALVADLLARDPQMPLAFAHAPDVVRALVERFVGDTTDPRQRAALEVCAVVRAVDEPTLRALVPGDDGGTLFRWLESRAFVDWGPAGLRPHDLARDVLAADLLWRAPDRHAALVCQTIDHAVLRLQRGAVDPDRVVLDVLFLHRRGLALGADWDSAAELRADLARPDDVPAILDMVRRHEGDESAARCAHWLEHGLEVRLVRSRAGEVLAFVGFLALERARPADLEADPATRAAWRVVKKTLRPGERANLVRWWMGKDFYQGMTPEHLILGSLMMRKNFTPGLALSLWPVTDLPHWTALNDAGMRLARLPLADFDAGGRRHSVFGMDLRERPMALWLADFTRRMVAGSAAADLSPARAVLTRTAFDRSLRAALKQLHSPARLSANPLAHGRLVSERVSADADPTTRAATLRRAIEEVAAALASTPRSAQLHAVLHHTFLEPAVKQEVAAAEAGLSFATYRRYLARALEVIGAQLWEQEIGAQHRHAADGVGPDAE